MIKDAKQLVGKKVKVYFNLHKKVLSVMEKGKVIAHVPEITLRDVKFKVSEAGRQRVLREQRKNVHAGLVGIVTEENFPEGDRVTYNPYLYDSFVNAENPQEKIMGALFAKVVGKKININSNI